MGSNTAILQSNNLAIGYGDKVIYSDLNISFEKGEVVCLLGQNGVGKSTLLKTLSGLIEPISGEILINNISFKSLSKSELAKVFSIVTTDKLSAVGLTVLDILMAGRYPHQPWLNSPREEDFKSIQLAVEQTNIKYLLEKKLHELSDGQRQKVMIARALVQDGQLIFLDEPTAHLDLTNRVEILKLLRDISINSNKSLVISTHELNLAMQFADKLLLMDFGSPIMTGTPEDLALSGDLSKIFHHQGFDYDLITGKVNQVENPQGTIKIEADESLKFWIKNAVDRLGYKSKDSLKIIATTSKNNCNWKVIMGSNSYKGVTIDELIKLLKSIQ